MASILDFPTSKRPYFDLQQFYSAPTAWA